MRNKLYLLLTILFISIGYSTLSAQNDSDYLSNSPYSAQGLGDLIQDKFAYQRSMGGIGIAMRSPLNINYSNPASYSAIKLTNYEFGLFGNGSWLNTNTKSYKDFRSSLAYMALAFPVAKFWGSSFGLMPYSSVNYNVEQIRTNPDIGEERVNYTGEGTVYNLYWGNGFKYKGFSLGLNLNYLFGNISKSNITEYLDLVESGTFIPSKKERLSLNTLRMTFGAQYYHQWNEKLESVFGIIYELPRELTAKRDVVYASRSTTSVISPGVIISLDDIETPMTLPTKFGIGLDLKQQGKWEVGLDLEWQQWANYETDFANDSLVNSFKIAFGASAQPKVVNAKTWSQRVKYSFGMYYKIGYIEILGEDIPEYGFSLGFGLPLSKRSSSRLNLSFEYGQRGVSNDILYKQNFFKTTAGFSLNDLWFIKKKFD